MDQMHEAILVNGIASAQLLLDQAKHGLGQAEASVRYPVQGGGDQTSSNSAALTVAKAKVVGAEAGLDAMRAAYASEKEPKPKPTPPAPAAHVAPQPAPAPPKPKAIEPADHAPSAVPKTG